MRVLCVFGEHNYGDPSRGESYEYVNFIPALKRLGHEVFFLESLNRATHPSFLELNQALLKTVDEQRPDVVLSVMHLYETWLETWESLRDSGITATVNWTTDDSWKYAQSSRLIAPAFHAITTTYSDVLLRYHADGIRHVMLTQWAADAATLQPPRRAVDCTHKVSFVGTAHGTRVKTIRALRQRGIEVECFGHGWPNGPVPAARIPTIMHESVVSLNFTNSVRVWDGLVPSQTNQIKARTFEVPGAGGFLLTEWAVGLDRYYEPGKEIGVYRGLDDLTEKISWYLLHPAERDEIAQAGYERTRREHTFDQRIAEVIDFTLQQKRSFFSGRSAGATGKLDWDKFSAAASRHKATYQSELARQLLVRTFSLIWGSSRGPRAARRFLFELSWRLSGAETYRASGLPGRLFYHES